MTKTTQLKKINLSKIGFSLILVLLIGTSLIISVYIYKVTLTKSPITIYDQNISAPVDLEKLEIPKNLNPDNLKITEYNLSSDHLILLKNNNYD